MTFKKQKVQGGVRNPALNKKEKKQLNKILPREISQKKKEKLIDDKTEDIKMKDSKMKTDNSLSSKEIGEDMIDLIMKQMFLKVAYKAGGRKRCEVKPPLVESSDEEDSVESGLMESSDEEESVKEPVKKRRAYKKKRRGKNPPSPGLVESSDEEDEVDEPTNKRKGYEEMKREEICKRRKLDEHDENEDLDENEKKNKEENIEQETEDLNVNTMTEELSNFLTQLFMGALEDQLDSFLFLLNSCKNVTGITVEDLEWTHFSGLTRSQLKYRRKKIEIFSKDHKVSVDTVCSLWLKLLIKNPIAASSLSGIKTLNIEQDLLDRKILFEDIYMKVKEDQRSMHGRKSSQLTKITVMTAVKILDELVTIKNEDVDMLCECLHIGKSSLIILLKHTKMMMLKIC